MSLIGNWPGSIPLTTTTADPDPNEPELDLDESIGQRTATYRFDLTNGVTGEQLGRIYPIRQGATLSHDTTKTTKRELRLNLDVADTLAVNPLTDRIAVSMLLSGQQYPLGRYMFTDETDAVSTGGNRGSLVLVDEMFLVDQQISSGFGPTTSVEDAVLRLVQELPLLDVLIEPSPYTARGAWAPGTTRGQILGAYATQGDYMTPWLDNDGIFRMVRTVDPDTAVATIDFDRGRRVIANSITETDDTLSAPNRFIVTSNSGDAFTGAIVGTYDVPPSAPYSIAQRGFVIPNVTSLQIASPAQATAAARNLGIRQSVFRRTQLSTAPDPRHDSYDVVRWRGVNWLELSWSLTLLEGSPMTHVLRRSFQ